MKSQDLKYLLITPARNEDAFIELTIKSVINQTIRPVRWIIVSDGSTDQTDQIVGCYAKKHDWIELHRMPDRDSRDFGGKAKCCNEGYAHIKHLPHDVVASLDADITFDADYFEFLLGKLRDDPKLGIVGTPFAEGGATYDYKYSSTDHVSGACQVFRRECFEQSGGYLPVKGGGLDVIAILTARSRGWRTKTFTEKACEHHRAMGSANDRNPILAVFNLAQRHYCLGFHPLWQIFRSIYQLTKRPYLVVGCASIAGYFWAMLRRVERPIGPELIAFQRRDQMRRLREFFHLQRKGGGALNESKS